MAPTLKFSKPGPSLLDDTEAETLAGLLACARHLVIGSLGPGGEAVQLGLPPVLVRLHVPRLCGVALRR